MFVPIVPHVPIRHANMISGRSRCKVTWLVPHLKIVWKSALQMQGAFLYAWSGIVDWNIAQLAERAAYIRKVTGSIPVVPIC